MSITKEARNFIKKVQSVSISQAYKKYGLEVAGELVVGGKGGHGKIAWHVNGIFIAKLGFAGKDNDKCAEKGQFRKLKQLYLLKQENTND